jgi:hypothetical protein
MSILELNGTAARAARLVVRQERMRPQSRVRSRLRALILLAGAVRPSPFAAAVKRSLLDLPIDSHHTLLDLWRAHSAIHVAYSRLERLPVRIVTNFLQPELKAESQAVSVTVERDRSELRGAGGVLHDIAEAYDNDDQIAVANANQILTESLSHLLAALDATGADVSLLAHDDGTPGGLMLARCGSLRCIPSIGFVDLKEQALPLIAGNSAVRVVRRSIPAALPVRTASDYVEALRHYHRPEHLSAASLHRNGNGDGNGDTRGDADVGRSWDFTENWFPAFGLCERGSHVDPSATLHDSVALRGARVDRGATVARSIICPGAIVHRNQVVVNQLVTPAGALPAVG